MKNRDQYKRLLNGISGGVIIAIQTAIFAFVWFNSYAEDGPNHFVRGNYVLIGLYAMMIFFFYKIFGGFHVGRARIFEIFYSQFFALLMTNAVTYLQLCLICRWKLMEHLSPIAVMSAVELVLVLLWSFSVRHVYRKWFPPRKMLLVYGDYSPDNLIKKIEYQYERYDIADVISIDSDYNLIQKRMLEVGSVILTDIPAQQRNNLLKFCFENDVRCYCVPKISDIMVRNAERIHMMDTTVLLMRNSGLTLDQKFAKRLFDIVVSLIAIILASPFMLVIALCVKLYDGGPVLFRQDRLTEGGRVFQIYKFRSMREETKQKQYVMTRKDDDRVTPVGKVIRNIHFDELPQLFNILKGDMSIVGPRPESPILVEKYKKIIPQFDYRLKVKAGLTGYAQVYGKYNTIPYDKLKMDLHYIENYSFLLDLRLILLTAKILFQKENTEGIESWQTSAAKEEEPEETLQ